MWPRLGIVTRPLTLCNPGRATNGRLLTAMSQVRILPPEPTCAQKSLQERAGRPRSVRVVTRPGTP